MTNFTKGEWVIDKSYVTMISIAVDNVFIADVDSDTMHLENECFADPTTEQLANAHLIAAAPDMYEALEQMVSMYCELIDSGDCGNWNPREDDAVLIANAALKKARGES